MIIVTLDRKLPSGYAAEPRIHLGTYYEIEAASLENGLPDQYEYEVLAYDTTHHRRLVAAVEIVSPANKDRPEH